ncbi:MAG: extracellular solute-binding protein [Lachnospiraceae bacterium]|nr:extracellular solute-binding protein [Lachnospiraceae bacterium]
MRWIKRIIIATMLAGILAVSLSGCGKKDVEDTGPAVEPGTESVYVPEYTQFNIECDYIGSAAANGDTLFINAATWDEDKGYQGGIYKYDLVENAAQLLYEEEENSNIGGMIANADGSITIVKSSDNYTYDDNGGIIDIVPEISICRISGEDGTVIDETVIADFFESVEYAYIQGICDDAQENIYLYRGDRTISVLDKDYQRICDIDAGDWWISSIAASKEGEVYVSVEGSLKKIDLAGRKLSDAVKDMEMEWNDKLYTGLEKSFLVSSNSQVSVMDLSAGTKETLFSWMDVDINADSIECVGELSDGRIWAIIREYGNDGESSFDLVYLVKKDKSEVQAKEEIILGTMWMDSDIRKQIIDFNKNNSQYRIVIKEYGNDDFETGLIQLGVDMTTEDCPDIISLSQIDFAQYANKGVFEDLYPYMEKSGIKKEDYLENILKAYEVDGSLYGIMPIFCINSIAGKASLVGEENGWTLTEMLDLVDEINPPYVMTYDSRDTMLWYCVYQDIDEFVNWETGECFFNGEEFIRALEFAARFPGDDDVDYSERESTVTLLHENKILLTMTTLSSVQEYQMMKGMFGEEITYVGFPNKEEKGNLIYPASGSFAMSSKSKYKDGVWEFLKALIDQEYQDSLVSEYGNWGFPVRKTSLDKQFELDMSPNYYEDEEGNQIEQPKTTWGWDDFSVEIMAATQEEIDAVKALIDSAERISENTDQQIVNIITEEAEPFFKGQKSAENVANIIQNRVQIYVNENR